ncbi:MAG: hypothetical protein NTU58_02050 [Candidatus Nealsonbacteria bacterium]|nr:hypothetical protein [Candidatus Nealsonbacteria bacterium]
MNQEKKGISSLFFFVPGIILFGIGSAIAAVTDNFIILGLSVLIFIIGLINKDTWKDRHLNNPWFEVFWDRLVGIVIGTVIIFFVVLVLKIFKII